MLITFSLENFRSFRDLSTIDLRATAKKPAYSWLEGNTVALPDKDERVVKVKAIYGENAGGKSTLLTAIAAWQGVAILSATNHYPRLPIEPFSLDAAYAERTTSLSGVFVYDGRRFEYGLKLTTGEIVEEWLYDRTIRKASIFVRHGQEVKPNPEYFGKDDRLSFLLEEPNDVFGPKISFLAAASLLKISPIVSQVAMGIRNIMVLSEAGMRSLEELPAKLMAEDQTLREETSEMLKLMGIDHGGLLAFDKENLTGVKEISGLEQFGDETDKRYFTVTSRPIKGTKDRSMVWLSDHGESAGTKKVLQLVPMIILCLRQGGVLVVDEFESQLHTRLSREIVQLFNSISGNPNAAQFIFSTHDTNLLDNKLLRRDQISLVEKDEEGGSTLYALSDIKGVTNTANFEREYLGGSYGAVPNVRDLDLALDLETVGDE